MEKESSWNRPVPNFSRRPEFVLFCESAAVQFDLLDGTAPFSASRNAHQKLVVSHEIPCFSQLRPCPAALLRCMRSSSHVTAHRSPRIADRQKSSRLEMIESVQYYRAKTFEMLDFETNRARDSLIHEFSSK
jgi:hypothetical protein